jgi:hypothetical protein
MVSNPVGPGTKTLGVNVSKDMAKTLKEWADKEDMSVSLLIKSILTHAINNDWRVKIVVEPGANNRRNKIVR